MKIVVIKLGGSLLGLPGLAAVLHEVLAQLSGVVPVLIVGGGAAADLVREWDRVHRLGDAAAHTLALKAMSLNEELVLRLVPQARRVRSREELRQIVEQSSPSEDPMFVFSMGDFFQELESTASDKLPCSWDVTSDSIAAWVAGCLQATQLVLLKSAPVPTNVSPQAASASGLVDSYFHRLACDVANVSWVNGRKSPAEIVPWLQNGRPVAT